MEERQTRARGWGGPRWGQGGLTKKVTLSRLEGR